MKKLIINILTLLIILVIVDVGIGFVLDKIIDKSPDGRYYKANYSLKKSDAEVVIFGASRAEVNLAPYIIEDRLNLSCWNAGRGAQALPFWSSMAAGILNRYTPKVIILDIEPEYLSSDVKTTYEAAGILRPFYAKHEEIRPTLDKISYFEKFLVNSKLYAYNSSYYYLLRPFLLPGLDGKIEDQGWKPVEGQMNGPTNDFVNLDSKETLNKNTLEVFNEFVSNFTKKGTQVFVVISPRYNEVITNTSTIDYIKSLNNVHLLDYKIIGLLSKDQANFKDVDHLNRDGALKFTKMISEQISVKMNAKLTE